MSFKMFKSSKKKRGSKESTTSLGIPAPLSSDSTQDSTDGELEKLKFTWVRSESLEHGIFSGQTASWNGTIYFKNGGSDEVVEYSSRTNSWVRLVHPPFRGFTLVVIDGLVTSVGGHNSLQEDQDKLVSLVDGKWTEIYPPMPTARHYAMATMSDHTLIVGGGAVRNSTRVGVVETLDIKSKTWRKVAGLPLPLSSASCCLKGDNFYLVGGFNSHGKASTVALTCQVSKLLQHHGDDLARQGSLVLAATPTPWREMAEVPMSFSTCAVVSGHVIVVGGVKGSKKTSGDIYRYDPSLNAWEGIGALPTPRYSVSVAVVNGSEMMVVGGIGLQLDMECVNLLEVAKF